MQYKVPQNIDQEDKILGPLTFIQFIYVLVGGGLILLAFSFFDLALFFLVAIPIAILTFAFAVVKIQDQPFSHFFMAFLVYLRQPKKRVWQDMEHENQLTPEAPPATPPAASASLAPAQPAPAQTSTLRSAIGITKPEPTDPNQPAPLPALPTPTAQPARKLNVKVG